MSSKPNDTKKKSKLKTLYFYQVVVNTKTTQRDIFTYKHKQKIPAKTLVEVDFRGRKLTGFVLREISKPNFPLKKIKPISKIIDYFPLLEEPQIKLAFKNRLLFLVQVYPKVKLFPVLLKWKLLLMR